MFTQAKQSQHSNYAYKRCGIQVFIGVPSSLDEIEEFDKLEGSQSHSNGSEGTGRGAAKSRKLDGTVGKGNKQASSLPVVPYRAVDPDGAQKAEGTARDKALRKQVQRKGDEQLQRQSSSVHMHVQEQPADDAREENGGISRRASSTVARRASVQSKTSSTGSVQRTGSIAAANGGNAGSYGEGGEAARKSSEALSKGSLRVSVGGSQELRKGSTKADSPVARRDAAAGASKSASASPPVHKVPEEAAPAAADDSEKHWKVRVG